VSATQRADSVASTIFHAWLGRMFQRAIADENTALRQSGVPFGYDTLRAVLHLLERPMELRTRDMSTGQSAVWDDLTTTDVRESRDWILLKSLDEALQGLETTYGTADMDRWLWGERHTVRFGALLPGAPTDIPGARDPMYPNGFPRAGGIEVVDASGGGWSPSVSTGAMGLVLRYNFSYGRGPRRVERRPWRSEHGPEVAALPRRRGPLVAQPLAPRAHRRARRRRGRGEPRALHRALTTPRLTP
jgi:hypothetical protein